MKLTFGIIVLNGDFFLRQVLESIYPHAHAICIAEGPVKYWQDRGVVTSMDQTIEIIRSFPDPQNKIKCVSDRYTEKDDQCRAWFNMVPDDTDYVICNDADEIHTPENIEKLIQFLEKEKPTSVGFKSDSFYGGFERIIGGFERDHSFKRVLQYFPGSYYRTHRQPTLAFRKPENDDDPTHDIYGRDCTGNQLYEATGITMWHGSYVSPKAVYEKIQYYEDAVIAPGKCIPNYINEVYIPWIAAVGLGNDVDRMLIEDKYNGVQEFVPEARGECKTILYEGQHPDVILNSMEHLRQKFLQQLKSVTMANFY